MQHKIQLTKNFLRIGQGLPNTHSTIHTNLKTRLHTLAVFLHSCAKKKGRQFAERYSYGLNRGLEIETRCVIKLLRAPARTNKYTCPPLSALPAPLWRSLPHVRCNLPSFTLCRHAQHGPHSARPRRILRFLVS